MLCLQRKLDMFWIVYMYALAIFPFFFYYSKRKKHEIAQFFRTCQICEITLKYVFKETTLFIAIALNSKVIDMKFNCVYENYLEWFHLQKNVGKINNWVILMLVKHMLVGYTAYMYILWSPFILNKKNQNSDVICNKISPCRRHKRLKQTGNSVVNLH